MKINGAEVQSELVSGTNIQTLNNASMLTSGNINIQQGYHGVLTPPVGAQITNVLGSFSATAQTNSQTNRITLVPFIFDNTITISAMSFVVNTGRAGQNMRVLMYSNNINKPNVKILESGNIAVDTSGVKTYTTTYTFNAGDIYWIGLHQSGLNTSLRGPSTGNAINLNLFSIDSGISYISYVTASYTFGSAPAIMNTSNLTLSNLALYMYLTISA
jgi:hypothetical protein